MKIVRTVAELRADLAERPKPVGLVPTMGALHAGHLSLIKAAASECSTVVATVFVNPTQFAPTEDLSKYPRQEALDAEMAESSGAHILFAPSEAEVYPRRSTFVEVEEVTRLFEGEHRPTHFRGVATVVLKLFLMAQPQMAYFGLKDLQQCAAIRRMTEDLNVPIELRFMPTLREPDGLAMSSRNVYLSPEEREVAPQLYSSLQRIRETYDSEGDLEDCLARERARLETLGFQLDYLEVVDPHAMVPARHGSALAAIVAARIGRTRLIDNLWF